MSVTLSAMKSTRAPFSFAGHGCSHRLPGQTVERRVADGFQVGTEAVLVLPPRFVAYFLPGIPVAEVRADEE
jgi:hypothetical protein